MEEMNQLKAALRRLGGTEYGPAVRRSIELAAGRAATEGLLDVAFTHIDSPLGRLLVAATPRGMVRLAYPTEDRDTVLVGLASAVSPRVLEAPRPLEPLVRQLDEYFSGQRRTFEVPIDWSLTTGFQRKVLESLSGVPYGGVTSYGELAARAGSPRAARATGNALGANPIPIIVPCHRVIRSGGALGGYVGGTDRKELLLRLEGAPSF